MSLKPEPISKEEVPFRGKYTDTVLPLVREIKRFNVKSYAEASRFPFIEIGGVPVPRLILGHLPFVGKSYQGQKKNCECCERFSDAENTIKILTKVVKDHGITVMGAMPATEGKLAAHLLEAISETMRRTMTELTLIPCLRIPLTIGGEPLDDYKRWLTYYDIEGISPPY